ncbi:MAG: DEAD/DEAH box helicase family protein [Ktedonobacteraceae bacterium]
MNAVGPTSKLLPLLLPTGLFFVRDLDITTLEAKLRRYNGIGRNAVVEFRVPPSGRFDAVLVPVGRANEIADRFLLALEEDLPIRDQLALYAHAIGHLLLNYQESQTGRIPELDPANLFAHADSLAELRALGTLRYATDLDRRVLEAYPLLTQLVEVPEESKADLNAATAGLSLILNKAGWRTPYLVIQYQLTPGRVYPNSARRGRRHIVDALLRCSPSLPIAMVRTQRAGEPRNISVSILQDYARRMALPFAYFLDEHGIIHEFDWTNSQEPIVRVLDAFPDRNTLLERWINTLQLIDDRAHKVLLQPYGGSGKFPRYYQEAAINQAVIAVLQARRGLRSPRILLTMATGTGKTPVAFQILWKLKKARPFEIRNVLFLTDRDFLVDQAMNEFDPFGAALDRGRGDPSAVHDMKFYTYQGITATDDRGRRRYLFYPSKFFDVVVVDECHRGSAQEASNWHKVLEHFSDAIQIGLTATPLSTETVQTDRYFGSPVYTYSLRMGINDGFLAPYRVRRVIIGRSLEEDAPLGSVTEIQEQAIPDGSAQEEEIVAEQAQQLALDVLVDDDDFLPVTLPATMETPDTMRASTETIAQHLATYMKRTDATAKTIVFCVDKKHAAQMRNALEQACAMSNPDYVVRIVAEDAQEGKRALSDFTNPEERYPVIVTTARLLSTGVDVLTCKNIVLARAVGSMVEFKQIIGRGTRIFGEKKTWFTSLDYAGAIKHFFDPAFDGDPEFVERELLIPEGAEESHGAVAGSSALSPAGEVASAGETVEPPPVSQSWLVNDEKIEAEHAQGAGATAVGPPGEISAPVPSSKNVYESGNSYPGGEQTEASSPGTGEVHTDVAQVPAGSATASAGKIEMARLIDGGDSGNTPHAVTPSPSRQGRLKQKRSGLVFKIIGEIVYELGPDGSTLRQRKYDEYAIAAIENSHVNSAADLRARWLREEQRAEILAHLEDEGVDLDELAYAKGLTNVDHLDLLLHVVFNEPIVTRAERVARLRQEHEAFFRRYEANPLAKQVLDVILEKYIKGEAKDVNDVELLDVPPLDKLGTPLQLARSFQGDRLQDVLNELKRLLYSV